MNNNKAETTKPMNPKNIIHSYYNPPSQVGLRCTSPMLTQQQYTEECNINSILKKFIQTGILDNIGPGVYADLGDAKDYRESLHVIKEAEEMFASLPSHIRDRFQNDPAQYLDFVHDENNLAEGQELGIFTKSIILPNNQPKLDDQNGGELSAQTA